MKMLKHYDPKETQWNSNTNCRQDPTCVWLADGFVAW